MSDADAKSKTMEEVALDHAWNWFEYHANQRMIMIRFYLIAAGGIAAGIGALLTTAHENLLAGLLSILGAITSMAFKRLDKRVSDLVKIGEDALSLQQAKIGAMLGSKSFEICQLAGEKPKNARFYTYGENFRLLFNTLFFGFTIVAAISLLRFAEIHTPLIDNALKAI
jgi:hypothetical protein